jgi:hypothetical protein
MDGTKGKGKRPSRTVNNNQKSTAHNNPSQQLVTPPPTKKQRKIFTLEDVSETSDDRNETSDRRRCKYPFKVIIVKSKTMQGFIFYATGFADKFISDMFFNRGKEAKWKKFIEHVEVVQHKCECLENGMGTGVRQNYKGFVFRTVAYVCEEGEEPTKEFIISWMDKVWKPAFKIVVGEDQLKEDQWPDVNDDSFETVKTWSDAVSQEDINYVFASHQKKNNIKVRMAKWIQEPVNLYSIYN